MFLMYFGNFLLNKGYISKEKFKEIIDAVENSRPRIGVIALHLGYLKPEDIERITLEQQKQNKKFGEIAVELGLLTKEQLDTILSQQPREFLTLSQVLIDREIFTYEELEKALNEFKEENQLSDDVLDSLRSDDVKKIIEKFVSKEHALGQEITEYLTVFVNSFIRFITRNVMIQSDELSNISDPLKISYQKIKGEINFDTYFIIPDETSAREFTKKYAKVSEELIDDVLDDSINEYLNLVNGLAIVNFSEMEVNCELEPPLLVNNINATMSNGDHLLSKIETDFGNMHILIIPR
ncbi:MAG: chemotaxis protein CheX [Fervidobacterium sp.]